MGLAEQAIAMEANNAAFLDTVGWIYYKMGTYKKAQEYLVKSLKINEDNPVILEHMGDIYHKLDASDEALLLYEKAHLKDIDNKINQLTRVIADEERDINISGGDGNITINIDQDEVNVETQQPQQTS